MSLQNRILICLSCTKSRNFPTEKSSKLHSRRSYQFCDLLVTSCKLLSHELSGSLPTACADRCRLKVSTPHAQQQLRRLRILHIIRSASVLTNWSLTYFNSQISMAFANDHLQWPQLTCTHEPKLDMKSLCIIQDHHPRPTLAPLCFLMSTLQLDLGLHFTMCTWSLRNIPVSSPSEVPFQPLPRSVKKETNLHRQTGCKLPKHQIWKITSLSQSIQLYTTIMCSSLGENLHLLTYLRGYRGKSKIKPSR